MARTFTPPLRRRLGLTKEELPDNATDEMINAALRGEVIEARQRFTPGPRGYIEDRNRRAAHLGPLTVEEREGILLAAVEQGKFGAERAKYWREQLTRDPGVANLIAMMASGLTR